ncbi:MAG TPA: ScyD/ScyE family protein [Mycobacteriales bacterium]|nr:ScyD/ScyE family protein [Mycobacteriales bacterium]
MRIIRPKPIAVGILAGATSLAFTAPPALAGQAPHHSSRLHVGKTISSDFVGPLQFAVAGRHILVADSFTSTLNVVGRSTPIATGPGNGGDLAGVAVDDHSGAIAYTTNNADHSVTALTILQRGRKPVVADLSGFERKYNPDKVNHYGVDHPTQCVRNALNKLQIPVKYTGQLDSHAYSVTAIGHGDWAVADAGGNDVLKVDRHGHVSLLSVLPRQPFKVTKAFAAANGLPSCAVGITYNFEPVPTDVEVGKYGGLYVTTLPGGTEAPGGAPGSVYRVGWHHAKRIATGFSGAVNLAIDRRGTIYVAEIFTGTIAKVSCGHPVEVGKVPSIVAIEYAHGRLYASTAPAATGGQGPGTIVELR